MSLAKQDFQRKIKDSGEYEVLVAVRHAPPNYCYTRDYKNVAGRMRYQKNKLFNMLEHYEPHKTEGENMFANGWDRLWNCGNDVYISMLSTRY